MSATGTKTAEEIRKENIGRALGRVASGVYVVTLRQDDQRDGILCSFIGQAAFSPPMISVAVKKERPILAKLQDGARFVVNVLSKNNMDLYKNFAKPWTEGLDRFAGLAVRDTVAGPVLSQSVSYLECLTRSVVEAGDHYLVIAEITDGEMLNEFEPMIHLRTSGFQY